MLLTLVTLSNSFILFRSSSFHARKKFVVHSNRNRTEVVYSIPHTLVPNLLQGNTDDFHIDIARSIDSEQIKSIFPVIIAHLQRPGDLAAADDDVEDR